MESEQNETKGLELISHFDVLLADYRTDSAQEVTRPREIDIRDSQYRF